MSPIVALFLEKPFVIFPTDWIGRVGFLVWFGFIVVSAIRLRGYQKPTSQRNWILSAVLVLLVPITSFLFGFRLPAWDTLPLPGITIESVGPAVMIFSALPWVVAAGFLGPIQAVILAGFSGVLLAFWGTHSLFAPLEISTVALLLAYLFQQRYKSNLYKNLREPVLAGIIGLIFYPLLYLLSVVFLVSGPLPGKIDYAFSNIGVGWLTVAIPILIACVATQIGKMAYPGLWGGQPPWQLSPAESSLEKRFVRNAIPLVLVLVIILMVGDWVVAGNAASQILQERMSSAAKIAADGVPYFLDTGQSLIRKLASSTYIDLDDPARLQNFLETEIRTVPFFRQLYVLDQTGLPLAGYPDDQYLLATTSPDEQVGIDLALSGVLVQTYSLPPLENADSAQISFLAAIQDEDGDVTGVLIGRTEIATNPFTQVMVSSLRSLEPMGGMGYLLDEEGKVLFHPDPSQLLLTFPKKDPSDPDFYNGTAPDGTRQLVYHQEAVGRPWLVVLTLPAKQFQQLSLNIAAPLLGMVLFLSLVAIGLIRVSLRTVTSSLQALAVQTDRISQGQLDYPLQVHGDDEIGQLRQSFEKMRISLRSRLDELNRLLLVSQGVASSLEMGRAVQPILESALAMGADAARVVLAPAIVPEAGLNLVEPSRYGQGKSSQRYSQYDEQILTVMADQDRIVLSNPARTTLLKFAPGVARPEALMAVALRHENQYYGTLWVAFDQSHNFTNEEARFIRTLAGQAALAAANTRLFYTAEYGRQRLAAILASTPDPVLVTDQQDRLLLVNPVAWQALGKGMDSMEGQLVAEAIRQPELVTLLRISSEETEPVEVSLPDGRVYLAMASSIIADGKQIGRVCILRDVTHFKELDALKSEFVSTVSHDLRSPLTLMRGYATMLDMVGDLNEQQTGYVRKIVVGVESMSRLVNNLLDLGRIEAGVGLRLEKISFRDLVEDVTSALKLQASQKNINFQLEIPKQGLPIIDGDPALLYQAAYNLIENAIKYTPNEKEIWVRVKAQNHRMILEVEDTGIGISPVDQPRLFEKFYRSANRDAKKERGTGLGLAIVKSIAERHKGRVWVESQLGQGSTFYFQIPVLHAATKTE